MPNKHFIDAHSLAVQNADLTEYNRELEDELTEVLHDLVVITLKFQKLAALCPQIHIDDIVIDEGEVIAELAKIAQKIADETFDIDDYED